MRDPYQSPEYKKIATNLDNLNVEHRYVIIGWANDDGGILATAKDQILAKEYSKLLAKAGFKDIEIRENVEDIITIS